MSGRRLICFAVVLVNLGVLWGQEPIALDPVKLKDQQTNIGSRTGWMLWQGPLANGADPALDDSNWENVGSILTPEARARVNWRGYGWFRCRLKVPPALRGQDLMARLVHLGAAEVYLDGVLIRQWGSVGETSQAEHGFIDRNPFLFPLNQAEEQLLAVHFSGFSAGIDETVPPNKGFSLTLEAPFSGLQNFWSNRSGTFTTLAFFLGFFLVFVIFHGLLFFYYPENRSNVLVALIGLLGVTLLLMGFPRFSGHPFWVHEWLNTIQNGITYCAYPLLIHYCYAAFDKKTPRRAMLWYGLVPLGILLSVLNWPGPATVIQIVALAVVVWKTAVAVWHRRPGAWTLGLGLVFVVVTVLLEVFNWAAPIKTYFNMSLGLPFLGAFVLMLLISMHVSRTVAKTNRRLAKELERVKKLSEEKLQQEREARAMEVAQKVLEADNQRKTMELEEARRLQLSMLPKKLPDHPYFEIAAFMETATEVGGDYYDFREDSAGNLTVAIGDATGHGTKAGTMVAAVKGLFSVLTAEKALVDVLADIHDGLRTMHMRHMFMALTLLKIEKHTIRFAVAGMPPLFIRRAGQAEVEMIQEKALPLGSAGRFPYREKTLELQPGDTLVLMSDGLPEMFNPDQKMLGEAPVRAAIAAAPDGSPAELIEILKQQGLDWRGEREQDDDVTLLVLKAKQGGAPTPRYP